ncbi:MAG TPA: efflux RND transporter periplasmic adaptor subunit, partial [Rhodocyclaceae bacterium]|nr:efflux RND transporter periplasmic adaptor subunit [Rhodocyclaceae bacterium]
RRDQARLASDRAGVGRQRAQYRLSSPIDGIVLARDAEPGSTVVAGQAVLRLLDPASLWVRTRIDQGRAAGLAVGQPASILLRSRPETPLPGRVARIEIGSDSVTEERIVDVAFAEPPPGLSPGELAEVTVSLPGKAQALVVPTAALRQSGGRAGVLKLIDGRTEFVPVRTGLRSLEGGTEILEGLREGDSVVHHAAAELKGGERVRVKESLVK